MTTCERRSETGKSSRPVHNRSLKGPPSEFPPSVVRRIFGTSAGRLPGAQRPALRFAPCGLRLLKAAAGRKVGSKEPGYKRRKF